MRKIKEVLRLHALGLSQRQIALSCAVVQATVSEYLKAAATAGVKWSEIADWDNDRLCQALAPSRKAPEVRNHPAEPDYATLRRELQTNKFVTLQLLWEEYRAHHPDGYRYSRFCDLYRRWLKRQALTRFRCTRQGKQKDSVKHKAPPATSNAPDSRWRRNFSGTSRGGGASCSRSMAPV